MAGKGRILLRVEEREPFVCRAGELPTLPEDTEQQGHDKNVFKAQREILQLKNLIKVAK